MGDTARGILLRWRFLQNRGLARKELKGAGTMQRSRVQEIWNRLTAIGFRTRSRNPDWYKAVVVSMLLAPGMQDQIEQQAREVIRVLDLTGVTYPTGHHPCFHFGLNGVPEYFFGFEGTRGVGNIHTLDDFGVYCATHNRGWRLSQTIGDECTQSCRYGMRMP